MVIPAPMKRAVSTTGGGTNQGGGSDINQGGSGTTGGGTQEGGGTEGDAGNMG